MAMRNAFNPKAVIVGLLHWILRTVLGEGGREFESRCPDPNHKQNCSFLVPLIRPYCFSGFRVRHS